jgi:recombinational DNA repair ATPase RecF
VLGQTETVLKHSGIRPVLLIDDLNAELDQENRVKMMSRCKESAYQVFITATAWKLPAEYSADKVFHVEHGVITETGV